MSSSRVIGGGSQGVDLEHVGLAALEPTSLGNALLHPYVVKLRMVIAYAPIGNFLVDDPKPQAFEYRDVSGFLDRIQCHDVMTESPCAGNGPLNHPARGAHPLEFRMNRQSNDMDVILVVCDLHRANNASLDFGWRAKQQDRAPHTNHVTMPKDTKMNILAVHIRAIRTLEIREYDAVLVLLNLQVKTTHPVVIQLNNIAFFSANRDGGVE